MIYVNSTPVESLKIIGLNEDGSHNVYKKRKKSPLCNWDDLKNTISEEKLEKLKLDDRIRF